MAIAKVADRANVNGNAAVTTVDLVLASLTVGNHLLIRTAADNSGGSGAARTVTVTNQSGTPIDTATDQAFQQNQDPGAASAGVTCNVFVATITATSGTVRLTYSGSVVQAAQAEEWSGIDPTTPIVGTPVGANGTASTNLASVTDASVESGNVAYGAVAIEGPNGDTLTQDADSTNGTWVALTKRGTTNATADTNVSIVGAYKITTGTGAQTYNPTNSVARDSAGLILELAQFVPVTRTGEAAQTLPSLTQSAVGTHDDPIYTATASQSIPAFTQSAEGTFETPTRTGTAAQTLPAFTQAAAGTAEAPTFTGTAVQSLAPFTASAAGTHVAPTWTGTAAQSLPAFTQSTAGSHTPPAYEGTAASILAALTQSAAGTVTEPSEPTFTGSASSTLPAVTQLASGGIFAPTYSGELVQILPLVTQSAVGSFVTAGGSGEQFLPPLEQHAEAGFEASPVEVDPHPIRIVYAASTAVSVREGRFFVTHREHA